MWTTVSGNFLLKHLLFHCEKIGAHQSIDLIIFDWVSFLIFQIVSIPALIIGVDLDGLRFTDLVFEGVTHFFSDDYVKSCYIDSYAILTADLSDQAPPTKPEGWTN